MDDIGITPEQLLANARAFEAEAALIERFAKDDYESAARAYGGGSYAFVRAIDEADRYMREANLLREAAAEQRAGAAELTQLLKEIES
ncbi:hypothetical protein [Gordonia sp. MP11Mi]|uniref:Uncharacterized protein n=1 Tax=Gordonia sp. MP11Mi TaxID=3022769 RepID=A0AA97D088_9ACTN